MGGGSGKLIAQLQRDRSILNYVFAAVWSWASCFSSYSESNKLRTKDELISLSNHQKMRTIDKIKQMQNVLQKL